MSVPKRKLSSSSSGPHGSRRFHNKTQERVHYANLTLLFTKEICIQLFCLYCILLSMGYECATENPFLRLSSTYFLSSWNFQNFKIDAISVPRNQHWVVWFLRLGIASCQFCNGHGLTSPLLQIKVGICSALSPLTPPSSLPFLDISSTTPRWNSSAMAVSGHGNQMPRSTLASLRTSTRTSDRIVGSSSLRTVLCLSRTTYG